MIPIFAYETITFVTRGNSHCAKAGVICTAAPGVRAAKRIMPIDAAELIILSKAEPPSRAVRIRCRADPPIRDRVAAGIKIPSGRDRRGQQVTIAGINVKLLSCLVNVQGERGCC